NKYPKLRYNILSQLKRIHHRLGITTIYVTHDQVEAMTLGDRIVVMSAGEVQQIGRPQAVYREPANLFVAGFIGSPPMNLLRGSARDGRVQAGELQFTRGGVPDGEIVVGVRPEALTVANDGMPSFDFTVDVVEPLGDEAVNHGTAAGSVVESGAEEMDELPLLAAGSRAPVVARFQPDDEPAPGDILRLGIPADRIMLFDARSGAAIA
ncbi:MAG: ABC transporter ATP-binding protein, partial [Actinomycetota bacterium]